LLRVHIERASKSQDLEDLLNQFLEKNRKIKLLGVSVTHPSETEWIGAVTYKTKQEKEKHKDEEDEEEEDEDEEEED